MIILFYSSADIDHISSFGANRFHFSHTNYVSIILKWTWISIESEIPFHKLLFSLIFCVYFIPSKDHSHERRVWDSRRPRPIGLPTKPRVGLPRQSGGAPETHRQLWSPPCHTPWLRCILGWPESLKTQDAVTPHTALYSKRRNTDLP